MEKVKTELRIWAIYFITLLFANFFHEVGHCIPAWLSGYFAIPTFAKAYSPGVIPTAVANYISLGGILSTLLFSVSTFMYFLRSSSNYRSSVLAGGLAMPAIYTLRFVLSGRGHDGTEFQEAQSALHLSYSGHFVDWIFIVVLIAGIAGWIFKSHPTTKILGRIALGAVVSIAFILALQTINNSIFDPLFLR